MRIDVERLQRVFVHDRWSASVVTVLDEASGRDKRALLAATDGKTLVIAATPPCFRGAPPDADAGRDVEMLRSLQSVSGGTHKLTELREFAGPSPEPLVVPCRHDPGDPLDDPWRCGCQTVPGLGKARAVWSRSAEWGAFRFPLTDAKGHADRGFDLARLALALSCLDASDTEHTVEVQLVTRTGRVDDPCPVLSVMAHDAEWRIWIAGSTFRNRECDAMPRFDVGAP